MGDGQHTTHHEPRNGRNSNNIDGQHTIHNAQRTMDNGQRTAATETAVWLGRACGLGVRLSGGTGEGACPPRQGVRFLVAGNGRGSRHVRIRPGRVWPGVGRRVRRWSRFRRRPDEQHRDYAETDLSRQQDSASEVLGGEGAAGVGFEVGFEGKGFGLGIKSNRGPDFPGHEL